MSRNRIYPELANPGNIIFLYISIYQIYIDLYIYISSPKDRSVPHRGGGEQPSRGMPGGAMPSGVKAVG